MKVAVTGAAGFLGLNLLAALLDAGHDVLALDRAPATIPAGAHGDGLLRWAAVDILDEDAVVAALDDIEVVYHLVALISLRQEDPATWRVNTEGVACVARAALRAGVRRVVHCGSLASFDYYSDIIVHEGTARATAAHLPVYHRSKYQGEVELLKVVDDGLDAVICNPTGIYGPRDHAGRLSRMNQGILDSAAGRLPASVRGYFDMVDVRDVAAGFLLAAEHGRSGHNYLLGGHRHALVDVQIMAARLVGRSGPRFEMPLKALKRIAPVLDPIARRFGSDSFGPGTIEAIALSPIVNHAKATTELGYAPRPLEETLGDLVDFFVAEGLLTPRRRR
ncbi:NAD-dependent epimerase/dehydratase family protein [Nocardioides marmorisolisilvae]|uniref:NAD-dependent epimerase/dehydratase family protein n=1 Tax=Nocardioides marmorisolisilvae TaxID=1542737 RepID=A0A3N0DXA3_9ACTN|nr:NAD-dependent epimerase/dehydratase family protein [Nocardioides marmorisolisilvae]RNL80126.1 NAD-dependent epimerase/dehydratase family protein [Nocardioides marmorisolisilvae]